MCKSRHVQGTQGACKRSITLLACCTSHGVKLTVDAPMYTRQAPL
jgi:hypothetical protein